MIHIISMWHNEEFLAPLFMNHYQRADKISIILDDCTDNTRDYLDGCEVIEISSGHLDDLDKARKLSTLANESDADLRIVVDSDEFIYGSAPIGHSEGLVYSVGFWEVFRHSSDSDIDREKPALPQRLHGNPNQGQCFGQNHFTKPIVLGRGVKADFAPGNHSLRDKSQRVLTGFFDGVHWAMADPSIALDRRHKKRARMSMNNKMFGLTSHDWNVTTEQIVRECSLRLNSERVVFTDRERF